MTRPLVLQTMPLGMQWPTLDPFLFCAHHRDAYPGGAVDLGPDTPLDGRRIGQDFDNVDGWNMYHGSRVPGFPQHPHRGFETVTYVRTGVIDHSDSLGAQARFGRGDTQWLTAGRGIVHCEMFPLLDADHPNPLELFQIWLNLPSADKMVDPYFTMLWAEDTPVVLTKDDDGRSTSITVIAGRYPDAGDEVVPPASPPDSWASRPDADVAIWHLVLEPGARYRLGPASGAETQRTLYVFAGDELTLASETGSDLAVDREAGVAPGATIVAAGTAAVVDAAQAAILTAGEAGCEVMMLQGRPIAEPVVQYGPFVMNTQAEIEQTFRDYQATGFGGWPWPSNDPTHGPTWRRFATHPDGRVEQRH